jgi:hypothetical protein
VHLDRRVRTGGTAARDQEGSRDEGNGSSE